MPKRFLKKWIPSPQTLKDHPSLRVIGHLLHNPNLWHLNRHSVARAFAVGLMAAFIPLPAQMLIAACGAIIFRANLPVSVALVWITNPFTMPPIFYLCYRVGAAILVLPAAPFHFEPTMDWFTKGLMHIWEPFLLGSFVLGTVSALIGYYGVLLFWKIWVWRARIRRAKRHKKL